MSIEVFEITGRVMIKNSKDLADMVTTLHNLGMIINKLVLIPISVKPEEKSVSHD